MTDHTINILRLSFQIASFCISCGVGIWVYLKDKRGEIYKRVDELSNDCKIRDNALEASIKKVGEKIDTTNKKVDDRIDKANEKIAVLKANQDDFNIDSLRQNLSTHTEDIGTLKGRVTGIGRGLDLVHQKMLKLGKD